MSEGNVYDSAAEALRAASNPTERACLLIALTAYPGPSDGLPQSETGHSREGGGSAFYTSMNDYLWWLVRKTEGLRGFQEKFGDRALTPRERWRPVFRRGLMRLRAAENAHQAYRYSLDRVFGADRLIKHGWRRGDSDKVEPKPHSLDAALLDLPRFWGDRLRIYDKPRIQTPDRRDLRRTIISFQPVFHICEALRPIATESEDWLTPEERSQYRFEGGWFPTNIYQHVPIMLQFPERWVDRAIADASAIREGALAPNYDHSPADLYKWGWAEIGERLIQLR